MKSIVGTFAACAWVSLLALVPATAIADHLFGNVKGNPPVAYHSPPPPGVAVLDPDPVVGIHMGNCPWLLPGLAVQGFDANGLDDTPGNADDWTITFGSLSAMSLKVEYYKAWADTKPKSTCSTLGTFPEETIHHWGGAVICLTYHPHAGDPAAIHWLQVIKTNKPAAGAQSDTTTVPGFSIYIDNVGNPAGDPFYDPIGAANTDAFFDAPQREFKPKPSFVDWEAQVFIATADLAAHTLKIWDGAWWGFELRTPEPSTMSVLGLGLLALLASRSQRRKRAQSPVT